MGRLLGEKHRQFAMIGGWTGLYNAVSVRACRFVWLSLMLGPFISTTTATFLLKNIIVKIFAHLQICWKKWLQLRKKHLYSVYGQKLHFCSFSCSIREPLDREGHNYVCSFRYEVTSDLCVSRQWIVRVQQWFDKWDRRTGFRTREHPRHWHLLLSNSLNFIQCRLLYWTLSFF